MENDGSALRKKACNRCGVNRIALETEVRKLRERLEYSELQNLQLSSECERLGKELSEATFRGRSILSPHKVPALPNEIIHRVFRFAVHLDDLVSPFWDGCKRYIPWEISLKARHSIPLVCRRWYHIGLEYLYEHIVLSYPSQIDALASVLKLWKEDTANTERIAWIRGIEFLMYTVDCVDVKGISESACQLIGFLPEGRLKSFGLEDGLCSYGRFENYSERIVTAAIKVSRHSLEDLHIPCTPYAEEIEGGDTGAGPLEPNSDGEGTSNYAGLSSLHSLSLTNGWWEPCSGVRRLKQPIFGMLTGNAILLRALSINLDIINGNTDALLQFLRMAVQLDTVTVIIGPYTKLLRDDLHLFFDAVPNLRSLLIGPSGRRNEIVPKLDAGDIFHSKLEQITLLMNFASSSYALPILKPLFDGVFAGNLFALERIIVCGAFPGGCVDRKEVFPDKQLEDWKALIQGCADVEVDLVNDKGDRIYLWDDEHGVKQECLAIGDGNDSSSSDEDQWWELESSEGSWGSSEDKPVSDDSEDIPYRYVSQKDLDYLTDPEESDWEEPKSNERGSGETGSEDNNLQEAELEEHGSESTGSEHPWGNLYG